MVDYVNTLTRLTYCKCIAQICCDSYCSCCNEWLYLREIPAHQSNSMTIGEQSFDKMLPEKSGPTSDKNIHTSPYILECKSHRTQCQTCTRPDQHDAVTAPDASAMDRFCKSKWNGGRYTIAALGEVVDHLLMSKSEPTREQFNTMATGLVRYNGIYLTALPAKCREKAC